MDYIKANQKNPIMGLNNEPCLHPVYWCKSHEVWLSKKDVARKRCKNKLNFDCMATQPCNNLVENDARLQEVQILAAKFREENPSYIKRQTMQINEDRIRGIPLKSKHCLGYNLYDWSHPNNKPYYDDIKVQYCFILATVKSISFREYKLQVMVDHDKKIVYFPTQGILDEYVDYAILRIQEIINGKE